MTKTYVLIEHGGEYDERYDVSLLWSSDKDRMAELLKLLEKVAKIGMPEDRKPGYGNIYNQARFQRLAAYGALLGESVAARLDPNCGWSVVEVDELEF